MSKPVRVRVRGPNSTQLTLTLEPSTTYGEFLDTLQIKFPEYQSISVLCGIPPKPVESGRSALITETGIRSGDTLILQDGAASTEITSGGKWDLPRTTNPKFGRMVHYRIPGDNSCLFHAIGVSMLQTNPSKQLVQRLKTEIAEVIRANPKEWGSVELGQSPSSYISQLNQPSFWGGAIEIAILSSKYDCEISVVDYYALSVTTFALRDDYKRRIYLLYNGTPTAAAHYDVLVYTEDSAKASMLSSMVPSQATQDTETIFDSNLLTIFSPRDEHALLLAKKIAERNHESLVNEGKAQRRNWTEKDMIKKKPLFTGYSGKLGDPDSAKSSVDATTTTTAGAATTTTSAKTSSPNGMTDVNTLPPSQQKPTAYTAPQQSQPMKSPTTKTSVPSSTAAAAVTKTTSPSSSSTKGSSSGGAGGATDNLQWSCSVCTLINSYARTLCEVCNTPRDGSGPVNHTFVDPSELSPSGRSGGGNGRAASSSAQQSNVRPPDQQIFGTLNNDNFSTYGNSSTTGASSSRGRGNNSRPWTCGFCEASNTPSATNCVACSTPRGQGPPTYTHTSSQQTLQQPSENEDWACPSCSTMNSANRSKCSSCRTKKPDGCTIM